MKPVNDRLHVWIVWSVTTLWRYPCDILTWVLDITRFAVNAVLEVHNKPWILALFLDHFVNTRWAVPLGGFRIFGKVH